MGETLQNQKLSFDAYIKAVQYLAGLTVHQHLWSEVVSLMIKFFSADFATICERLEGGEIIIGSDRPENHPLHACFRESRVKGIVAEVFDSGFIATDDILADEYHKVLFLPISSDNSYNSRSCYSAPVGRRFIEGPPEHLSRDCRYHRHDSLTALIGKRAPHAQEYAGRTRP